MSWLDEVVESCGDSVSERLAEELHRAVIIAHEVQQQQRLQLEGRVDSSHSTQDAMDSASSAGGLQPGLEGSSDVGRTQKGSLTSSPGRHLCISRK